MALPGMEFAEFAVYLKELEDVAARNTMVELLAKLFATLKEEELMPAMYLLQGRVCPLYEPIEFGLSGKLMLRAIAKAYGTAEEQVEQIQKKLGDLGKAAEVIASRTEHQKRGLKVADVHRRLLAIAQTQGEGSVEEKLVGVAGLLTAADPLSARYIVRMVLDTLRLGFSDMTMLEGLSWMLEGTKEHKAGIERAYNIRPDLGYIAEIVKTKGMAGLQQVEPRVGTPILMARAERATSAKDIIDKIGECAVEQKIDGFRLQAHFNRLKGEVKLFTRNLEVVTDTYPDIVAGVKQQVAAKEAIFEGEAVGFNEKSGDFLPFQETVQRKRKYHIAEKALEVPLKFICFDVLLKDGKSLLDQPYSERRRILVSMIGHGGSVLKPVEEKIVRTPEETEKFFQDAVTRGLEGIIAKRLDGIYQAGARDWNWIKYKRSYSGRLEDTVDVIVMGYDVGQGKRTDFGIGALLIGVYDKKKDVFATISKMGTGLTDDEWRQMKKQLDGIRAKEKPARYSVDKMMSVDVWVEPKVVVQVRADEITRSPVHTAGRTDTQSGYALRFPRLEKIRDKLPEDATNLKEVEEMFAAQGKKKL